MDKVYEFNPPKGPIAFKYEAFRDGEDFAEEALIGPVGCVHGDTEIFDARVGRGVKISDLYDAKESPTVLALNDKGEFIHAVASVPFKKGKAYLYKVRLENGNEITVTRLHEFLTPYGYLTLEKMIEFGVSSVLCPSEYALDVRHYSGTFQDYQGDCLEYYHFYDEPLRLEIDTVQLDLPSRVYVPLRSYGYSCMDGQVCICNDSHENTEPLHSTFDFCCQTFLEDQPSVPLNASLVEVGIISIECQGFDWFYDIHVPVYENYVAEGIVNHNTAKSSSALDFMLRRAYEYPGSNILIVRATLQNLKGSTLLRLEERFGSIFLDSSNGASMNRQEGIYRFPYEEHPITGKLVQSTIRSIGIDRESIANILRSTEFSTIFIEEANEVPSDSIDELQIRSRQQIYHRSKKVKHLCFKLSSKWGVSPEEVYEILTMDKRHRVAQMSLGWDDPMPGSTVIKLVWNPDEDNHVWQRMVGMPYPEPHPDEAWVKNNIGIREVHVQTDRLLERKYKFVAGTIVMMPDGTRRYAARHEDDGNIILVRKQGQPDFVNETEARLVVQRNTIYAFPHENESRDFENDTNSFLIVNQGIAARAFLGAGDKRKGRVFSNYVDDYVQNGGNLIKDPGWEKLAQAGWKIVGGIDMGGNHAHAVVTAMMSPQTNTLIFFGEMCKSNLSNVQVAMEARNLILPGCPMVLWGHDPSMAKRVFDDSVEHRYIDTYRQHLIDEYRPGDFLIPAIRGDAAFDYVNELMVKQESFINTYAPKIVVVDTCDYIRVAMRELTWHMVDHERSNFRVDVGDAVKYAVSMRKQTMVDTRERTQEDYDNMLKANLAY